MTMAPVPPRIYDQQNEEDKPQRHQDHGTGLGVPDLPQRSADLVQPHLP
jgi:hypothetical protein